MKAIRIALAAAALLISRVALAAEIVSTCGQTYEGAAVLTDDLDCTGDPNPFILLTDGALDLAGHTIKADIFCTRRPSLDQRAGDCVIQGPGTVRGCIDGYRLQINDVTMSFADGLCDEDGSVLPAVRASASVNFVRSQVTGYPGSGLYGYAGGGKGTVMTVVDSTIHHSGVYGPAVAADRLHIFGSTIEGEVVLGIRAELRDTQLIGVGSHYDGLWSYPFGSGRVKLVDSSITGMVNNGIRAGNIRLKNSAVTGSCTGGTAGCEDVVAKFDFKAAGSTCGSSFCEATAQSCGVCLND